MSTTTPPLTENITILDLDHPGAKDPHYRARRDEIAAAAAEYRASGKVPRVNYTDLENETWSLVSEKLKPLHQAKACRFYKEGRAALEISSDRIPEFVDINKRLESLTRFRIVPVEGLVDSRSFLGLFKNRTMLCTQYIRHHSRPEYTPEPDIVHEVIGHVPSFTNPDFVEFMEELGDAAEKATDKEIEMLERLYWWTVEYGLIQEDGETKVFGAGLLGSFGEMEHAFEVPHLHFELERCVATPFDYTHMQPQLFVIESLESLREKVAPLLRQIRSRS